jgi:hypothetical protein
MNKRNAVSCALAALAVVALAFAPRAALAFCGFYVGGADAKLFNGATQVVLMRDGLRTVLSMQNDYQGPPEGFALVVPVPVVLQRDNVRTLPKDVFDRVDKLTAPRLVEYWEQDPCAAQAEFAPTALPKGRAVLIQSSSIQIQLGVTVEAKFAVGEYEVVILSATDSTGLDTWLRREKYKIPEGAEPYLRPYVQSGSKFFVAKVDPKKVTMVGGHAALSPLRFHYDTNDFSLPVRLGLINSAGTQDLIVYVMAQGQRYEPANYASVTIPTNLDVAEEGASSFGPFYAALFDRTIARNPGAVVTEYSWDASSCDPCPGPALQPEDFATLGADVVSGTGPPTPVVSPMLSTSPAIDQEVLSTTYTAVNQCWASAVGRRPAAKGGTVDLRVAPRPTPAGVTVTVARNDSGDGDFARCAKGAVERFLANLRLATDTVVSFNVSNAPKLRLYGWTITRLHTRYGKDALGQDLVFRPAPPIMGGREVTPGPTGELDHGAQPDSTNNFQGRYAIRHPWKGAIACAKPQRGVWGGSPGGVGAPAAPRAAQGLAFVARDRVDLASLLRSDVPELGLTGLARPLAASPAANGTPEASAGPVSSNDAGLPGPPPGPRGCHGCAVSGASGGATLAFFAAPVGIVLVRVMRRRRARGG